MGCIKNSCKKVYEQQVNEDKDEQCAHYRPAPQPVVVYHKHCKCSQCQQHKQNPKLEHKSKPVQVKNNKNKAYEYKKKCEAHREKADRWLFHQRKVSIRIFKHFYWIVTT